MDWETIIEMTRLLNSSKHSEALDVVTNNINEMDDFSWDIFFTGLTITSEIISKDLKKHQLIRNHIRNNMSSNFRVAYRMAHYEQLVDSIS